MSCEYARSNGYAFALEKFRAKINEELEKAMEQNKKYDSGKPEFWRAVGKQDILLDLLGACGDWIGQEHEK
jgi:hypothetical protein